jgi:hypothetical protein
MIIFKKLPSGEWEKSGAVLPTEREYTIAVDAEKIERMVYPCAHAVQEVENRIKAGTQAYRFELASPPASLKNAARARSEKTVKRILGRPETQKAKAPVKAKAKSGKKQSHAEIRRQRMAEGLCGACGKRKRAPKPAKKGGGFYAECGPCKKYYDDKSAEYRKAAKKGKK